MIFPRYSLSPGGSVERTARLLKWLLRWRNGGRRGRGRGARGGHQIRLQPGDEIGRPEAHVLIIFSGGPSGGIAVEPTVTRSTLARPVRICGACAVAGT
jgi:hypothetical protein